LLAGLGVCGGGAAAPTVGKKRKNAAEPLARSASAFWWRRSRPSRPSRGAERAKLRK